MRYRVAQQWRARRGGILVAAAGALMVISAGPVSAANATEETAAAASARSSAAPEMIAPSAHATPVRDGESAASRDPDTSTTTDKEADSPQGDVAESSAAKEEGAGADSEAAAPPTVTAESADAAAPSVTKATESRVNSDDSAATDVEPFGAPAAAESNDAAEPSVTSATAGPTVHSDDSMATDVEPFGAPASAESTDAAGSADTTRSGDAASAPDPIVEDVPYVVSTSRLLHALLAHIEDHWEGVFENEGEARPFVDHYWVRPGEVVRSSCAEADGTPVMADDHAAFYCGADDVIYIGEVTARSFEQGIGTFASGVVLAHEYAHNVQDELGISDVTVRPIEEIELQADCLGGVWMKVARADGLLDEIRVARVIKWASTVGDAEHGTGEERVAAWTRGSTTGSPSACGIFVPTK